MQSFLVVYDWVAGLVEGFHDGRSSALVEAYLAHAPYFHVPATRRDAERFVTPGGAGLAHRPALLRYLAHGASQIQVTHPLSVNLLRYVGHIFSCVHYPKSLHLP